MTEAETCMRCSLSISSNYCILHGEIMGAVLNLTPILKNAVTLGIDYI